VVVCAGGVVRYKLSDLNVCSKDLPSAAVSSRGIGGKHSLLFAVRMDKSMFQDIHDMIKMNDLYKTNVMDWDIDYDGELY